MQKKWYKSRTVQIQILQVLQGVLGLVTVQFFPSLSKEVLGACAFIAALLGKLQIWVRSLPDHGSSITDKQQKSRENAG